MIKEKISILSDLGFLTEVRAFISEMINKGSTPKGFENKIILAVDEAVSNVIEHGYDKSHNGDIEIEVESNEEKFAVYIRDSGAAFDPNSMNDIDIAKHIKEGKRKGLGIFLMRRIMDEVRYTSKDNKNELMLVKYIKRL